MSIFANESGIQGARIMPPPENTGDGTGFDAFGKPVSFARRERAYQQLRSFTSLSTADAMLLIGRMAEYIERDQPHEAMQATVGIIDLTGMYRILAYLCTDPE